MQTVTTHEAKTHLSRLLVAVENGEEILIARLLPAEPPVKTPRPKVGDIKGPVFHFPDSAFAPRPKVGETLDPPFQIPDSAFAPLTEAELREWGL